jgi:hypothetical protein
MIDITSTIASAYAFVWRERLKFAWLAMPAVFGLTVFSVLSGKSTGDNVTELGISLLLLVLFAQFAVAWYRYQLLPDGVVRLRGTYRFGRQQRHYLLLLLGLGLLTAPIFIGAGFFSFYVTGMAVELQSIWFQPLVWLISLPLQIPALLIFARLALCFPAAAIDDRRLTLLQGWQQTRGFGWPLAALILLASVPAGLFSDSAMTLAHHFASTGTATGQTFFFLLVFLGYCLFFLATAVLASTLSIVYRQLVAELESGIPAAATPALRRHIGLGRWLVNALIAGFVLGGVTFVGGSIVFPIFRPSNLAPLMGFFVVPFGFLFGFLLGLVWNFGKLGTSKLAGVGIIVGVIILDWHLLMSPNFIPGFIVRGMLLDADVVPSVLKKPLAPSGTLQIWAINIPPEEQVKYSKRLGHYVGGPIIELNGNYTVSFHTTDSVNEALRQPDAQQHGPDIFVSRDFSPIEILSREPGIKARLVDVVGSFPYRGMGPFAFIDREGANYVLARNLARYDSECRNRALTEATSPYLGVQLGERSVAIASAIVTGDAEQDRADLGAWRMRLEHAPMDIHGPILIESSRFCGAWGSSNLAFAEVVINFEAEQMLGQRRLTLALRREGEDWRLLSVSESKDSRKSIEENALRLERIMLNRNHGADVPPAAIPGEPYEYVPAVEIQQRSGYLMWKPGTSYKVVAEVAEIACRSRDHNGAEYDDIQLIVYMREPQEKPRYYVHASKACSSGWPWKWRLWTVTGGGLTFSDEQLIPTPSE